LKETIIKEVLGPTIKLASSPSHHFPGGSTIRTVICHKLVDVVYVIGLRLGFEQTRNQLTGVLNEFFTSFNLVYGQQLLKSESSKSLTDYKTGRGNQSENQIIVCEQLKFYTRSLLICLWLMVLVFNKRTLWWWIKTK
jgi:WD repeat-containing protein 81